MKQGLVTDVQQLEKPENIFTMGSGTYIKLCLTVYEQLFEAKPKRVNCPLDPKDHPELDQTDFLD